MAARKTKAGCRQWTLEIIHDRCEEVGDCWIWKHCCNSHGMPQASIHGKTGRSVRVFIYDELLRKMRPAASTIGSSCGDGKCCNPDHLMWKSRSAVIREAFRKRGPEKASTRLKRREHAIAQGITKLNMEKAADIRNRRDEGSDVLAQEYGVNRVTVTAIWRGDLWSPLGPASVFNLGA